MQLIHRDSILHAHLGDVVFSGLDFSRQLKGRAPICGVSSRYTNLHFHKGHSWLLEITMGWLIPLKQLMQ